MRAISGTVLTLLVSSLTWTVGCQRQTDQPLPNLVIVETIERDLVEGFARARVVEHPPGQPAHVGGIQPSPYLDARGGYRRAIIAPPETVVRYRIEVPADAVLRYGSGVARDTERDRNAAAVNFEVAIDGRRVASRSVNPARSRHHRRWFDDRLSLAPYAGRTIELTLTTRRASRRPLAGTPAWSAVRVVREHRIARQPARSDAPNLIVLLVDTLRADRLGIYGHAPSPSPNLDALAAGGLVFEHSIAQAPWTMPSVASIFTGLHPRAHGVLGGSVDWGRPPGTDEAADFAYLSDRVPTFAALALHGGVTTFAISTNPTIAPGTNLGRGFETFVLLEGRDRQRWARAAEVNDRFLAWTRTHRKHRFLAYLHYMDVHEPYEPLARGDSRPSPPAGARRAVQRGRIHPLRAQRRGEGSPLAPSEIQYLQSLYDGEIRGWDAALGDLLDGLERLGIRDDTNIIVTSDHGEEFQEHGRLGHGSQLFDETLRVPLVLAGPSIPVARRTELAQGIDLLPTILALLDLPAPPGLAGESLLSERLERPVVSETRYGIGPGGDSVELLSVRTPTAKLIHAPDLNTVTLYDLANDPGETHPAHDAARLALLLRTLERWRADTSPAAPADRRDPALTDKLRALGYLD